MPWVLTAPQTVTGAASVAVSDGTTKVARYRNRRKYERERD